MGRSEVALGNAPPRRCPRWSALARGAALIALFTGLPDASASAQSGGQGGSSGAAPAEGWKPSMALRLRYELGDQSGLATSHATTARLRAGLKTPRRWGLSGFGEIEATRALDDTSYQAASVHGTGRGLTVIADPESSEINQLWADFEHSALNLRVGRQRFGIADQRFVGSVSWRQNEQTFDAASLRTARVRGLELRYAYLWRANRIFGSRRAALWGHSDYDSRSHLVDLDWESDAWGTFGGYAYFIGLRGGPISAASNDTLGIRWSSSLEASSEFGVGTRIELAVQTDAGRSPASYRAHYGRGELFARRGSTTLGVGYEVLTGDGGTGFQTPLATGHKFNGFADVFLLTPGLGLIDRYAWLAAKLPLGVQLRGEVHDFAQEDSRGDWGREYDLVLSRKLPFGLAAGVKYAVFTSESSGLRDLRRLTVQVELTR